MSAKYQIATYLLIINYVKQHRYAPKEKIIGYINEQLIFRGIEKTISNRSFSRYLSDIRSDFGISIEYCTYNRGYNIPNDETPDDLIINVLEDFLLLNALTNRGVKQEFVFCEKRRSRGIENFIPLKNSIEKLVIVQFEYRKYYPEGSEIRLVEPYALKESRGRWYLLGFDKGDTKTAKSFGLDRMVNVTLTADKFEKRSHVDWEKKYEHCFAMFTNEAAEPETVILSFDHRDGNYIESFPLHSSQKITRQEDRTIIELRIKITLDFIMELMSRSWSIEVIEPRSLRTKLHEIYTEAEIRNR